MKLAGGRLEVEGGSAEVWTRDGRDGVDHRCLALALALAVGWHAGTLAGLDVVLRSIGVVYFLSSRRCGQVIMQCASQWVRALALADSGWQVGGWTGQARKCTSVPPRQDDRTNVIGNGVRVYQWCTVRQNTNDETGGELANKWM